MKNKKIATLVLSGAFAIGGLSVSAAQPVQLSPNHGYAVENSAKNGLDYDEVGGGNWTHGIEFGFVVSNYQHRGLEHGSTAFAHDDGDDSGWQNPDTEARAKRMQSPFGGNKSYWRTR